MLYLEDYLELIEHLPQETVHGLTDMRELDLQVQNSSDNIKKRVKKFFNNANRMRQCDIESEHNDIRKDFKKTIEHSEEKVHLANTMTDSLAKYMRRLDQDILKFKIELEADNSGITDIIERRVDDAEDVLPLEITNTNERQRRKTQNQSYGDQTTRYNPATPDRKNEVNGFDNKFIKVMNLPSQSHSRYTPDVCRDMQEAASQAITATQQMQQGRRSASLKASYEAINNGKSYDFNRDSIPGSVNRENTSGIQASKATMSQSKRHRKRRAHKGSGNVNNAEVEVEEPEPESIPDDEPRYCICNEIAYGEMVACDSPGCPYEWYHYRCAGVTSVPAGKWYCSICIANNKKKGRK